MKDKYIKICEKIVKQGNCDNIKCNTCPFYYGKYFCFTCSMKISLAKEYLKQHGGHTMNEKDKLSKVIEDLEKSLSEAKSELESMNNKYTMRLQVSCKNLYIMVGDGPIGFINSAGKCAILNNVPYISRYELWRENGMKVDDSVVKWRDGGYWLENFCLMRITPTDDHDIYNFKHCFAHDGCEDENIVRHKHNKRPILF